MRPWMLLPLGFVLLHCERTGKLGGGRYEVSDREYSDQAYVLERALGEDGSFTEKHLVDRCLLLEQAGTWTQEGSAMTLRYSRSRSRESCRDSLPGWAADSVLLEIPVRNVNARTWESLLAASDGKPEKWIQWVRVD